MPLIEPEALAATMWAWPAASFFTSASTRSREVQGERNLERDEDQQKHVREGGEQPEPEAHQLVGRGEAEADAAHGVDVARLARSRRRACAAAR